MEWLLNKESQMDVTNNNGHGVLHKAAQRGWDIGCRWFVDKILLKNCVCHMSADQVAAILRLIGPDTEGKVHFHFQNVYDAAHSTCSSHDY